MHRRTHRRMQPRVNTARSSQAAFPSMLCPERFGPRGMPPRRQVLPDFLELRAVFTRPRTTARRRLLLVGQQPSDHFA